MGRQNASAEGSVGPEGPQGDPGDAATIAVGTVSTGAPGSFASVTNIGTPEAATLDFSIPRGDVGPQGPPGTNGTNGTNGATGPGAAIVGSAELTANAQGSGSGDGTVTTASFAHVAGRTYEIRYSISLRRSNSGLLVIGLSSSLVTLPANRFVGESVSGSNLSAGASSFIVFVADSTGTSTITLFASAKQGGQTWTCNASTEASSQGAHARISIVERTP